MSAQTAHDDPKGEPVIEIVAVDGRPNSKEIKVNGKRAGFIVKNADGYWWSGGLPWPGFQDHRLAARSVMEHYKAVMDELAGGPPHE